MADEPKSSPVSDPAAKSGPVRPPVLEGSARAAGDARTGADKPGPEKPAAEKTTVPPPPSGPKPATGAGAASKPLPAGGGETRGNGWLAGIAGGVIGLGAAYGLAWAGLWPAPAPVQAPADPRLGQLSSAVPELQTVTTTLQDELSTLTARVASIETEAAQPAATSPADGGLAEQLDALSSRVEALASAPAPSQDDTAATANAQAIAALKTEIATLREDMGATQSRLATSETQLQTLATAARAEIQSQQGAARLPLILSSLESAFSAGRPFEAELTALRQAMPDAAVPEALSARAASGLPQADRIAGRLEDLVPDILAGRPADPQASWQDGAMDWMRGIIAMRPTGETEGEGPDAVVARLEAAVGRRDFVAAESELAALPEPMRRAASPVADDIAALAGAQSFLSELRLSALGGESAT